MSSAPVMPGAEPWSFEPDPSSTVGALVIHGFTGNPTSMRGLAEAFAAAGFHVEMPLLPGHGTAIEDILPMRWADWHAAAEAAYAQLAARCQRVVVAGLSMGGALTLRLGADHPEIAGLICVNPVTMPAPPEVIEMIEGLIADGIEVAPAIGGDIADPEAVEVAYDGTPLRAAHSMMTEGLGALVDAYPAMRMPLLLCSSPQDHVVEPAQGDHLAATYGGPVRRVTLERSYHVATQDYDKGLIEAEAIAFAREVTSA